MMMNKNNLLCTYLVNSLVAVLLGFLAHTFIMLCIYSSNDDVQLSTAVHRNLVYS